MKLRLALIALFVSISMAACTTSNPVAPSAAASPHMDDNGNFMGSGH
jgi:hypothetical protein